MVMLQPRKTGTGVSVCGGPSQYKEHGFVRLQECQMQSLRIWESACLLLNPGCLARALLVELPKVCWSLGLLQSKRARTLCTVHADFSSMTCLEIS